VFLSSHLLAEVEELCNRVAIIRSGRIVYEGAIAELKRTAASSYRLRTTDQARALEIARAQPEIEDVRPGGEEIRLTGSEPAIAALSLALVEGGALIHALAPETVTLEDLFFSLTEGDPAPSERPALPAPVGDPA
jgi:ABC-2 type transport system ATP-binding protein